MKKSLLLVTSLAALSAAAEFPNSSGTPGEIISRSFPELGRLTTIEVLGDYIIAIPEIPSAPVGSDFVARAIDISDPANPVLVRDFGRTGAPILSHGTIKFGNQVYLGGFPNNAVILEEDGSLTHGQWTGPTDGRTFNTSDMYHPWGARHWWSYQEVSGLAYLRLDGEQTAEWDHLGLTGVVGFPTMMGDLLIYSSDQTFSGMATYDISDPTNPVLLDVLNTPSVHPTFTRNVYVNGVGVVQEPVEYGIGGYWSAPYGHYMVFARRGNNPGIQVVDFSDPTDLKLHCEVLFQDPELDLPKSDGRVGSTRNNMYLNFQDEYIFSERLKINIETCEVDLVLDEIAARIETSQYSRPLGNMLLTGGGVNYLLERDGTRPGGLGIWTHQAEPDTRPPFVAYHIPVDGEAEYPVFAPISIMIPETLHATTIIPGDTLIVEEVGGDQVEVNYLVSHTGMLTIDPQGDLKSDTTYRVTIRDFADAVGNLLEPYTFTFSTESGQTNNAPTIQSVGLVNDTFEAGQTLSANVIAADEDGDILEYRFRVNDEEYSSWSSSSVFSRVFEQEGSFRLTAQVRDGRGGVTARLANFVVNPPPEPLFKSLHSSPMALNADETKLWVVNPDNLGVGAISVPDMELVREPRHTFEPRSIGIDATGDRWIAYQHVDRIEIINQWGGVKYDIQFDYGAKPVALLMDAENNTAYVSLQGSGEIVKIDTETREIVGKVSGLEDVYALSLSGDRGVLLATRFISPQGWGEVWAIDPDTMSLTKTIVLEQSLDGDTIASGRGVPNYLASVTIDGTNRFAYVTGKKDNVGRGLINGNDDLDEDNTVRTFVAQIDLSSLTEIKAARIDIDNSDSPSALELSQDERFMFVALQGNNLVSVFERNLDTGRLATSPSVNFSVGLAPQGLLLNESGDKLYVKNFTDRSVSQIDLSEFNSGALVNPEIITASSIREGSEKLEPQVLRGKQIFYNASFGLDDEGEFTGRTSAEGYMSCATCHFDGGEDKRVYDFTGRGEGLRNNLPLNGRGDGTARFDFLLHWSGNFDEVQDFENDIRNHFLGRGLMTDADFDSTESPLGASKTGLSEDLDALAAYVESLRTSHVDKSPFRQADGSLTASAVAGHDVFVDQGCQSCHYRFLFSDGRTHDVGTITEYTGNRSGGDLSEIRTPFLIGMFDSAPYMHDGSAETIEDVFITVGGDVIQAENAQLGANVEVMTPEFSFFRAGAAVAVNQGETITVSQDSTEARTAYIRVRYGSAQAGTELKLEVNGQIYSDSLDVLPLAEGEHVAFGEAHFVVSMAQGVNDITLWPEMNGRNYDLVLDDIIVSTEEKEKAAYVHTKVNNLSVEQQSQLVDYLEQLDIRGNVPR